MEAGDVLVISPCAKVYRVVAMEMHKVFREWGASIESYDFIGSLWPLLMFRRDCAF